MKKTAIAASLALGLASSAAFAGGIQIDPTGTGSGVGSVFIIDPGSSRGNMLLENVLFDESTGAPIPGLATGDNATGLGGDGAVGGGDDAFVYAHNSFDLTGFGLPGAELTFLMTIPVTSTLNALGNGLTFDIRSGPGVPLPTFELFYDDNADAVFSAVGNTAEGTGLGYGNGVKIAQGTVSLDPNQAFGFTNSSLTTTGQMASNTPGIDSISGNGSGIFLIDFDPLFTDTNYVVNALDALTIDLASSNSLNLRYSQGPAPTPVIFASTAFGDGAVTPDLGADGDNDFGCGDAVFCDFQAQMNTTLSFNAPRVPEPATVALLGAGLAMFGGAAASRRRKA